MTAAIGLVRQELAGIGYSAIENDYVFSDVFARSRRDRRVPLAAFTHTPPSYRNAALAVAEAGRGSQADTVSALRALGAPLLLVVDGHANTVTVWQVRAEGRPEIIAEEPLEKLPSLFAKNRNIWNPLSIHRAKSIGQFERACQLDFVDLGLLPVIEDEIHAKLDRLINDMLAEWVVHARTSAAGMALDDRSLFRTTFRLLAAKVLQDRGHEVASRWDADDIDSVLDVISAYYGLRSFAGERTPLQREIFGLAWSRLRAGINFRNISADDLAFVYENTLVTPETRKHFGTHSTPRQVADYAVVRLGLWHQDQSQLRVYEPFAGAGVFLVAALRRIRDRLPLDWTDRQRHDFLVQRITGDELDSFACEVAVLSLILADYPNHNGWDVSERDLMADDALAERAAAAHFILCNPPFESFTGEERARYPQMAARSFSKAAAVLRTVLECPPAGLGFVLPRAFIDKPSFREDRRRVEACYADIELVALPERTFKVSGIESCLLIAQSPRVADRPRPTSLRSSIVAQQDRGAFLRSGKITTSRTRERSFDGQPSGELWIRELEQLWRYLSDYPALGILADIHRGIEWKERQDLAVSVEPRPGYRKGLHSADAVRPFTLGQPVWLDVRRERLLYDAIDRPWHRPKVAANAVRRSRGPWRLAAAVDQSGLVCSQQIFGCWVPSDDPDELAALAAVLNGPVANAFMAIHSPAERFLVATMRSLPVPPSLPRAIRPLVEEYRSLLSFESFEFGSEPEHKAARLLNRIDALTLEAYDLPPRLERELLEYFRAGDRPTLHGWSHWLPEGFQPFIPLGEYLSEEYKEVTRPWIQEVFRPLPKEDAEALNKYLD